MAKYKKLATFGYDLGDGETIVDVTTADEYLEVDESLGLRMPDSQKEGQAIPTGFGYGEDGRLFLVPSILQNPNVVTNIHAYFKRRPTDLLGAITEARSAELIELFRDGSWPSQAQCPEVYSREFTYFRETVQTFTNAIFSNAAFQESAKFISTKSDEVIFCVGHPTRWNRLDSLIYRSILNGSTLGEKSFVGKPASLLVAEESRAAYLYMRDRASIDNPNMTILPKGTCSVLIDVGSSTIDVTAVTADARNSQYNSGDNHLGVRGIDFLIRDWYLKQLRNDPQMWKKYQDIIDKNPTQADALTLACRDAKEKVYSTDMGMQTIYFGMLTPACLTRDVIDELARNVPVGPILQDVIQLPKERAAEMGNQSWVSLFRKFLKTQKSEMEKQGLKIGRVIMTGSATKMTFVPPVIWEVFGNLSLQEILQDATPSRSISRGLALVGPSNAKSERFQLDVQELIQKEVPKIIADDMQKLADSLAPTIDKIVSGMIRSRMVSWRNGNITTINEMTRLIKSDCSEKNLQEKLNSNSEYKAAIENWTVNVVGKDIALKLQAICQKYHVSDFTVDSLNVMKGVKIDPTTGRIVIDPAGGIVDIVADVVSAICGLIAAFLVVDIAALVIAIVSFISVDLAAAIFVALVAMGPVGWAVIAAVLGLGVATLVRRGLGGFKDMFVEKVQSADLPGIARKILTDNKINEQIANGNMESKIKQELLKQENKNKVVKSISASLEGQIQKRAEDIKFVIESK